MDRDPITNQPLPPNAIQRVLFLAQNCHIYRIPPPSSPRYLTAALWTTNPADHIFTARLRLIETAIPVPTSSSSSSSLSGQPKQAVQQQQQEKVTATILLEDASSGDLFAAAPYTHITTVTQATDSSRFFAIRVVGEGGMKATLGLGFEERPVAFDFSIALQDARRTLGLDPPPQQQQQQQQSQVGGAGGAGGSRNQKAQQQQTEEVKRDLSLKEGEMITIKIGGKGRKALSSQQSTSQDATSSNPFAIAPPPSGSSKSASSTAVPVLPPPPLVANAGTVEDGDDDGFDDGEFGEFQ